jgi:hypothetical protein
MIPAVRDLYKRLIFLGREYPEGLPYIRKKLKAGFLKNREVTEASQIDVCLSRGEYIVKELEALYKLKKYRHLKKMYYDLDSL